LSKGKYQGIKNLVEKPWILEVTDEGLIVMWRPLTIIEDRVTCLTLSNGVQPSLSPFERDIFITFRAIKTKIQNSKLYKQKTPLNKKDLRSF
jgi:hypothetical protein